MNENIESSAIQVANLISCGEYDQALGFCSSSRLKESDLDKVIKEYGRTLVKVKLDANDLDIVYVDGSSPPAWSIRVPLNTVEEGRSDLTLELTVIKNHEGNSVELDDLRVL
ncbi:MULTISPECIES: DUF7668 domain-containing protein [unclassified Luteibacter]|uniref:DUF7668 domain-containing protein n=1 Tax=Luteibacter sp. PvP019 TaxID=3156436 RepID=UPI0033980058